jgi:hypothetical protein
MKSATFLLAVGFLLTFGAVGGIENDGPLVDCLIVAFVGLGIMGCGALMLNRAERPVDNPSLW